VWGPPFRRETGVDWFCQGQSLSQGQSLTERLAGGPHTPPPAGLGPGTALERQTNPAPSAPARPLERRWGAKTTSSARTFHVFLDGETRFTLELRPCLS